MVSLNGLPKQDQNANKAQAFVLDPDNYWVEIIQNEKLKKSSDW